MRHNATLEDRLEKVWGSNNGRFAPHNWMISLSLCHKQSPPLPPVFFLLSSLMLFFCLPTLYDLLMCSCCRCEMAVPTISRILFLFHFWPLLYMVSFFITSYRVKYWRNQEWHWSLGLCFQKFCELCSFVPFLRKLQQILP